MLKSAATASVIVLAGLMATGCATKGYVNEQVATVDSRVTEVQGTAGEALARAKAGDVLLAMTFKPYRRDVVEAVEVAKDQGLTIIALSDSPASPILRDARHGFLVPVDTPQFFTSTVALSAFLEALMAFVIAEAGENVVASIDRFHQRRQELGIYLENGE